MSRNVVGFLLFVASLIMTVGFVWPYSRQVREAGIDLGAARRAVEVKKARLTSLQRLESVFAANTTRVDSLISVLPTEPEIPETLVTVAAMAQKNGLAIQSLSPRHDEAKQQVTVTLVGDGNLGAIEGVLADIAANSRPISVSSLSLTQSSDASRVVVSIGMAFPYKAAKKVAP